MAGEPAPVFAHPGRLRDELLMLARDAVRSAAREGVDPLLAGAVIADAWLKGRPHLRVVGSTDHPTPGTVAVDRAFTPEPGRGVESLAFVVYGNGGTPAAGIILRIPGEHPDSFEGVAMPDSSGGDPPAAIRAAFYG